jgi:hypothetical protein
MALICIALSFSIPLYSSSFLFSLSFSFHLYLFFSLALLKAVIICIFMSLPGHYLSTAISIFPSRFQVPSFSFLSHFQSLSCDPSLSPFLLPLSSINRSNDRCHSQDLSHFPFFLFIFSSFKLFFSTVKRPHFTLFEKFALEKKEIYRQINRQKKEG